MIKIENYHNPEGLKLAIKRLVYYYYNQLYHESLDNLTPSDVYFGRSHEKLKRRAIIKNETLKKRRELYNENKSNQLKSLS